MPAPQWFTSLPEWVSPPHLRLMLRAVNDTLRPPKTAPFTPGVQRRQRRLLAGGNAFPEQVQRIEFEDRPGVLPTLVVGGFVPGPKDATYLQRGLFQAHGGIYYLPFAESGFNTELFEAQLGDLVEELAVHHGTPPVVFAVSFGAGLVLQWLRRESRKRRMPQLAGVVLVSPVGCTADILESGVTKPSTLLGRVVKGYFEPGAIDDPERLQAWVDKSRQVMVKMFESGAQNRSALRQVLSGREVVKLRANVIESMRSITPAGACERIDALARMEPVGSGGRTEVLHECPVLVLFAEKESSIMVEQAPTRLALERRLSGFFPQGEFALVENPQGAPVQHASLLFHFHNFEPHLNRFYKRLRQDLPGTRRIQHTLTRFLPPAHVARRRKAEAAARAAACSSCIENVATSH